MVFADKLNYFLNPHGGIEKYLVPNDDESSDRSLEYATYSLSCLTEHLRKLMTSSPLSITL